MNDWMQQQICVRNHFPYLPIVMNPENNPCIQMMIWIAIKI